MLGRTQKELVPSLSFGDRPSTHLVGSFRFLFDARGFSMLLHVK